MSKTLIVILAGAYLANHTDLKAEIERVAGGEDAAIVYVGKHLENIQSYFDTHKTVDQFYSTSNDQVFFTEHDAKNHVVALADKLILPIHRVDVSSQINLDQDTDDQDNDPPADADKEQTPAVVPDPPGSGKTEEPEGDNTNDPPPPPPPPADPVDYTEKTAKEMFELCKERGIETTGKENKAALNVWLQAWDKEQALKA